VSGFIPLGGQQAEGAAWGLFFSSWTLPMCQLLGMNCNTPTDIIFSFTGFANRAGITGEHVDGWGIAFFDGRGVRLWVDHLPASSSPFSELVRRYPIKASNVISHIRKATVGGVSLANCHPFMRELWGRYWVFAHNGDLFTYSYAPGAQDRFQAVGTTDSERAFCQLLNTLAERFERFPGATAVAAVIAEQCQDIARFGSFNFMLSDGEYLFSHCSTKLHYLIRQHPFSHARLSDEDLSIDFATVTTPRDRVAVIVTEPLTHNEVWHPFAPGDLKVFADGQVMFETNCLPTEKA